MLSSSLVSSSNPAAPALLGGIPSAQALSNQTRSSQTLSSQTLSSQALAPIVALPSPTQFEAYARAVAEQPFLSEPEEAELIARWRRDEDRQAAWRLVVSHLRLVVRVVRAHSGYGLPPGDLAQEGTVGLMKAVRRFDPARGVRLAAYALRWIEAEVREFIFRNWRLVRLTGTTALRRLFFGYRKTVSALNRWGEQRSPDTAAAVARALDVPHRDVRAAEGFFRGRDEALEHPPIDDEGSVESVGRDRQLAAPEGWEGVADPASLVEAADFRSQARRAVHHALAVLPERDRAIVAARRLQTPPEGLSELGRRYGVSAERVRQIEVRAWKRLEELLRPQASALAA